MADKTVSDLTSATTLDGTELFYLIQSANSRKVAGSEIVKISHNQAWSTITSTPTTLDGYGITDAQALDSDLTAIAALDKTDGNFIVADGTAWTVENGATARTSLGLGTAATTAATDYATAAQGTTADSALQPGDIGTTVQAQGATLDSLEGLTLASGDVLYASAADTLANLAKGTEGQVLKVSATGVPEWGTVAGTGDMLAATYDPNAVSGDAFDMANMVEATDAKIMTAAERTKLTGIEAGADVTDAANVDAAGATMNTDTDVSANAWVLDEDDMASDSATKVPTQQSVKAYVDANAPVEVDTPDDITTYSPPVGAPAINVLGYPTSPGSQQQWVRLDAAPSQGPHETDATGQVWGLSPFTVQAEKFGTWKSGGDVTDALQAALDFSIEAGFCSVLLPAVPGVISADLAYDMTASDNFIAITGQGMGASRVVLDCVNGVKGFNFHQDSLNGETNWGHFRNFSVWTDGSGVKSAGSPLAFNRPAGGALHGSSFMLDSVGFFLKDIANDNFGDGAQCRGALNPIINKLFITGPWGPGIANHGPDTDALYARTSGIDMDNTYGGIITSSRIWGGHFGIHNEWATGPGGEGLSIADTVVNGSRIGLFYRRLGGAEPSIWVKDSHFNCREKALWLEGIKYGWLRDLLIYNEDAEENSASAAIDVYMKDVRSIEARNIKHHFAGDSRRIAYQVDTTGTLEDHVKIVNPVVEDGCVLANLAYIGAGATAIEIVDPDIQGTVSSTLLGGGYTPANVGITYTRKKTTRLTLATTDQSIADGLTSTAVAWNHEVNDDLGLWDSGSPTRITIPLHAGIREIRFKANVEFDTNSTGVRDLVLKKSGAIAGFGFREQVKADAPGENILNASSGWITTSPGDYFEVFVGQSTGAALNLLAGLSTWLEVETR